MHESVNFYKNEEPDDESSAINGSMVVNAENS